MNSKWLWAILVIIILALGGWYVFGSSAHEGSPTEEVTEGSQAANEVAAPGTAMVPAPVTVTYTDQGFSPATVTITQGQSVTWVNQSSKKMWVASGVHPTHTVYDGTSKDAHCAAGYTGETPFDECTGVDAGASYSFTFTKAGDWKYHNHMNATDTGEVVVTASTEPDMQMSASTTVNAQ